MVVYDFFIFIFLAAVSPDLIIITIPSSVFVTFLSSLASRVVVSPQSSDILLLFIHFAQVRK